MNEGRSRPHYQFTVYGHAAGPIRSYRVQAEQDELAAALAELEAQEQQEQARMKR